MFKNDCLFIFNSLSSKIIFLLQMSENLYQKKSMNKYFRFFILWPEKTRFYAWDNSH